jgi:8-oxo-dGTP pyrophosphatase MutT (NUDIX family)
VTGRPGWAGRLLAAIAERDLAGEPPPVPPGRRSAVLVLVADGVAGPDLLLIERAATLRHHPGQPAFPGGALDRGETDPVLAALREAEEETGLDPAGVEVLAVLPPIWIPPSGYVVEPVLGWWRAPAPVSARDTAEVARVVRVPVRDLADPANRVTVRSPSGYTGPGFTVAGLLVWGFTGHLVDELLRLGGWERPWRRGRVLPAPGAPPGPPAAGG